MFFMSMRWCLTIQVEWEGIMVGTDQKALAEAVGRAIAKQRMRCGMTQDEVAEILGVGNEAVSRIERGIIAAQHCSAVRVCDDLQLQRDGTAERGQLAPR
ncbi:helix-turn-helix domain-containing protein [Pseudomonas aeruginosa]